MKLHIRRIKMDDDSNRKDIRWILFEEGRFNFPILIFTDYELGDLMNSIDEQNENHKPLKLKE